MTSVDLANTIGLHGGKKKREIEKNLYPTNLDRISKWLAANQLRQTGHLNDGIILLLVPESISYLNW